MCSHVKERFIVDMNCNLNSFHLLSVFKDICFLRGTLCSSWPGIITPFVCTVNRQQREG